MRICCSYRGSRFSSQHPYCGLQKSKSPVPEFAVPFSDLHEYHAHMQYIYTHVGKYSYCLRVSIAVMKHHDQSNLGRQGLLVYASTLLFISGGTQRAQRSAACWLAHNSLLRLLSYKTQDHQPRGVTTHNRLDPSPSIINQENALQLDFMEAFFST